MVGQLKRMISYQTEGGTMKADKINVVINLSILALLIYLAVGMKDLRQDFGILTQSIHKVMTEANDG